MNTPAHLAASLFVWKDELGWSPAIAVSAGAIMPDAPMFVFYGYQKLFAHRPEREIWSTLYYDDGWQLLFDTFNSIPLLCIVVAISGLTRFRWGYWFASSAILHALCDLPLHHDDAHRHFLPLSHWRFASPISYWDPRHHGILVALLELAFAIGASLYVARLGKGHAMRIMARINLGCYALALVLLTIFLAPRLLPLESWLAP